MQLVCFPVSLTLSPYVPTVTWPGQATAYKVGERFLHRLRSKAETELAEKFDKRDYYDVVLQCGAVPLDTLEELVNSYIQKRKSSDVSLSGPIASASTVVSSNLSPDSNFLESMTFANWCKCCVVPGSCQ